MPRNALRTLVLAATALLAVTAAPVRPAPPRSQVLIGYTQNEQVWVVGAVRPGGGWRADAKAHTAFRPGALFHAYDLSGARGEQTIGKTEVSDGVGGWVAPARGRLRGSADAPALAVSGATWPVAPRVPRRELPDGADAAVYRQAVADLLRAHKLTIARPRITQRLRVDLNGDGRDEVLLCAHSRAEMGREARALKGDYAVAALRFVSPGGIVRTVPLAIETYDRDRLEGAFAAGHFEILGCADVDGDGRQEIIVRTGYYEGEGVEIFSFDGKRPPRRVLSAGWGA